MRVKIMAYRVELEDYAVLHAAIEAASFDKCRERGVDIVVAGKESYLSVSRKVSQNPLGVKSISGMKITESDIGYAYTFLFRYDKRGVGDAEGVAQAIELSGIAARGHATQETLPAPYKDRARHKAP